MDVKKTDIKRFITSSDIVFVIPVYQRNYDWKKENCVQLFNDIKNLVGNNRMHFIGTICYKMDGRYKCVIIDGQQRITTIMLLLKALYDVTDNVRLKTKIRDQFLINPYGDEELRLKLKPIKRDEAAFKALLEDDENQTVEQENGNIFANYQLFRDLLTEELKTTTPEDFEDAVERLEIVEISLTDENPQVIFESLNSTGLGLTNTDLLRNYLLMSLDYSSQEKLYNQYWLKMEELIGSENMEQFIVDYLILKRKSNSIQENGKTARITVKTLYSSFKKQFPYIGGEETKNTVESCFAELYKYAKYYKHFIYSEKTNFRLLSAIDKKLYELFYMLKASQASVLLMWLYDKYDQGAIDDARFLETIDICISFAFRCRVCSRTGFSSQFSALTVQKLDPQPIDSKFKNRFWSALSSGRGNYSFPTDSEFEYALANISVYQSLRSGGTKYLLYKLEKALPHSKELPAYKDGGTVEHILPQHPDEDWQDYLKEHGDYEEYENYIHYLGNLSLTNYNSELSNHSFDEKKKEYTQSNYAYTKKLADIPVWTIAEILKRGKEMAKAAVSVWKAEGLLRASETEVGVMYDLQADFEAFYGTKPDKVCVLNEEKEISNWYEFMQFACVKFNEFDHANFERLIHYKGFPATRPIIAKDPAVLRSAKQIADGLFFEANQSTVSLLKDIKCIAEYFEGIYDSDLQETIWFSIRRKS